MRQRYDITTDTFVPVTDEYIDMLEEVYRAYGRLQQVILNMPPSKEALELQSINMALMNKLNERRT